MEKYQKLNPQAAGIAGAALGFLGWLSGIFWHGMMGQPSMMGMLYPMYGYMNTGIQGGLLISLVAGGFVLGWLGALIYNKALN